MPTCVRAQTIRDVRMICRIADGFCQQAVLGRHLVERRGGQRLHEKLGADGNAALNAGHHRIEIVERAESTLAQGATLRSIRIDVVKILEPSGYLMSPNKDSACRQICVSPDARPVGATMRRQMRQGRARATVELQWRAERTGGSVSCDYSGITAPAMRSSVIMSLFRYPPAIGRAADSVAASVKFPWPKAAILNKRPGEGPAT